MVPYKSHISMKEKLRQKLLEQMGASPPATERSCQTARRPVRSTEVTNAILVIDDETSSLEFVTAVLENNGYHVLPANSVAEGKSLLQAASRVPIIITDLKMPQEDGFALLEYLRDNIRLSHIPVIVLTCCTDRNIILRAVELGARDYLIKPFPAELLLARVKRIYDKGKGSILLITDNNQAVVILKRTLMADGFRVFSASTVPDVKELLGRERFDLAICELVLEDNTGLDLMMAAREDGHYLPFLFITDPVIKMTDDDIKSAGGYGLIKKPFNNADVLRGIGAAIAKSRHL